MDQFDVHSQFAEGQGLNELVHLPTLFGGGQIEEAFDSVGIGAKQRRVTRFQNGSETFGLMFPVLCVAFVLLELLKELLKEFIRLTLAQRFTGRAASGKTLGGGIVQSLAQSGVLMFESLETGSSLAARPSCAQIVREIRLPALFRGES